MKNLLEHHPSDEVRAAALRLLDALTQWERSTGRKNLVIIKDGIGVQCRSLCNGPIPAMFSDAEALQAYENMP